MTRGLPAPTITHVGDERSRTPREKSPYLYVTLECEDVESGSARYALVDTDEVLIGRSDTRSAIRSSERRVRRLTLGLPDRWLSSTHAHLSRVLGRWMLEDAKSKNGTFVNGTRVSRAELAEGDLIEAGHVFLVFRSAETLSRETPIDSYPSLLAPAPAGLRTVVPALGEQFAMLGRVATSEVSVIVHGESGTGKELVARGVHQLSGRTGPFIAVNCGALPASLVEGELFGHKKGAFSGATEDRPGLVRAAHRGTLFLDEIGDLPLSAQPAFLRVLQEHEVLPVGATQPVRVDVRLVCATHRDLARMVAEGKFRADLLARLSGFLLELPPLRERRAELGMLVSDLFKRLDPRANHARHLALEAGRALMLHDWPLNVRELEKCLGTSMVLAGEGRIEEEHLPEGVRRALDRDHPAAVEAEVDPEEHDIARPTRPLSPAEEQHRDELTELFRQHAGNISAVARALGKARVQIQRWVKRYGLDPESFRS